MTEQEKNTNTNSNKASNKVEDTEIKQAKKSRKKRQVRRGNAYIQATYNNTIVSFSDMNGNVLITVSAGQCGFKGPKKATPYAAGVIVRTAVEKIKDYGLKEVSVMVKGIGGGREGAIRALQANNIDVVSIRDVTPLPHNGCRKKKPRRV